MASILENLKSNAQFHFFGTSTFIKYPEVQASQAVNAFKAGREAVFKRAQQNQDIHQAQFLEQLLNTAAKQNDFNTQLDIMAIKIMQRMEGKSVEGLEAGVDSNNTTTSYLSNTYNLFHAGGTSYSSIGAAARQAAAVYQSGLKAGKTYYNITGAIGGGSYDSYTAGSAYYFLNQLNNGDAKTVSEILSIATAYNNLGNLNGELLERVVETAGEICYQAGIEMGSQVTEEVMANLASAISSNLGTVDITKKTYGQYTRHVQLDLGKKTGAIIWDSQGKADVKINFPNSDQNITLSAKSVKKISSQIKLLTQANLMGLLAGAGIMSKENYSALTVYTAGANYSQNARNEALQEMKKMLIIQALSGTTDSKEDLANYMVFQVGNTGSDDIPHFKIVPISMFLNESNLNNNIEQHAKLTFIPNPLPIGAHTYIEQKLKNGQTKQIKHPDKAPEYKYPRTQATLDQLFKAKVSIVLKSGFLKGIYHS